MATNREIQLQKTCELYTYVLTELNQEVPYAIEECASSYEYPVDCMNELVQTLRSLDKAKFDALLNKENSAQAYHLTQWWQMYETYIPIQK